MGVFCDCEGIAIALVMAGVLRWLEAGGRDLVMTGGRNLASQIPKFCTLVGNVIATTP